jgi:hypothetical protein
VSGLRTLWAREEALRFPFFFSAFTTASLGMVKRAFEPSSKFSVASGPSLCIQVASCYVQIQKTKT